MSMENSAAQWVHASGKRHGSQVSLLARSPRVFEATTLTHVPQVRSAKAGVATQSARRLRSSPKNLRNPQVPCHGEAGPHGRGLKGESGTGRSARRP